MSSLGRAPLAHAAPDTVFAPAAIELIDLRKSFGKTAVLNGVSLRVESGERVALIGPNGAGKSTLLDLVSGRAKPSFGEIWLSGRRVDGLSPERVHRSGLARSFQTTNVFARLSVSDNLKVAVLSAIGAQNVFWRALAGVKVVRDRVDPLLERLGLASRRDTLAGELSYAEQRTLELGITVAGKADVLLLDEPTAGMSQSEAQSFVELIRTLLDGRSLLMVERDMNVVFGLADRIAVLVQGSLLAFDTPAKVRANPRVQAAYLGVLAADAEGAVDVPV